jgi:asparagine synthetase B (glutamine-hydrolysing)
MDRLVHASPVRVFRVPDVAGGALWSSGSVASWRSGRNRGHTWSSYAVGDRQTSWQVVAESSLASGLATTDEGVVLHNDAVGLGEIYARRLDQALYFASRIDPLLELDDASLHVDWTAWACILSLGAPLGDATPFAEIRRVGAASGWVATAQGLKHRTFEPEFVARSASGVAPSPTSLVAHLRESVSETAQTRMSVTLSGGWDSRLLGALASEASSRRVRAWTTSPDDGHDLDISLSKPVARQFGMKHHVHVPHRDAWVESLDLSRHRLQHQTWMHTWLMPLAAKLHRQRGVLLDGLGGDVLLKSLFVAERHLEAPESDAARRLLWAGLGGSRLERTNLLSDSATAEIAARSWEAFRDSTQHLSQHPAGPALSVLHARTTRSVGASPMLLFGPECDVSVPFLKPAFMAEALRVPPRDKIGGSYYRHLLELAAGSRVAGLPSTNDKKASATARRPQRQTSKNSLARLMSEISDDAVVTRMLRSSPDTRISEAARSSPGVRSALQALSTFAAWRRKYANVLASEPSPF